MTLDKLVKELRNARGYSQAELAELSCVNQSDISNYEAGKTIPSRSAMQTLASALRVPKEDIERACNATKALKREEDHHGGQADDLQQ